MVNEFAHSQISRFVVIRILLVSFVFSLFSVATQLYVDFRRDVELLEAAIQTAIETSEEAIENAVWEFNEVQITYQLNGLVQQALVGGVSLKYGENRADEITLGKVSAANRVIQRVTLEKDLFGKPVNLGSLTVYGDIESVYQKTQERFGVIILSQGIKTFLLSLFILFLIDRIVLRRILQIAAWSEQYDKGHTLPKLSLSSSNSKHTDEIDTLVDQLNRMGASLNQYTDSLEKQVKERTEALESATLQAQAATQAKSEFLSNISHELRTPMNAIVGFTDLALRSDPSIVQRNYLEKVLSASDTLTNLINNVLDFSKIEAGKLVIESVPFDLRLVIQNAVNMVSLSAKQKGVELITYIAPDVPNDLVGDPTRLQQVITNLCVNAVKFTHEGYVSVEVKALQDSNKIMLHFSVADTGIGISQGHQDSLFDSFTQADTSTTRQYGGTGLGLAICKQLCHLMGGTISVESRPEIGSTFHFCIEVLAQTEGQTSRLPSKLALSSINALVVDDLPLAQKMVSETLASFGIHVDVADNGQQALNLIKHKNQTDTPYNLLLLDWKMPDINGSDVAKKLPDIAPALLNNTVMLSAYDKHELMKTLQPLGILHYLEKPVSSDSLVEVLHTLFGAPIDSVDNTKLVSAPNLQGKKILLVEDNKMNQQVALGYLKETKATVDVAENGQVALDKLEHNDDFDLVLMDIQMPVMNGLEATQAARDKGVTIPIIAMTAHAMNEDKNKSLEAGMNEHIHKPINLKQFYSVLLVYLTPSAEPLFERESPTNKTMTDDEVLARLATIEAIDVEQIKHQFSNQFDLFRKILITFMEDDDILTVLSSIREDSDEQRIIRAIHTLKSNASYIGAHHLAQMAASLEAQLAADFSSLAKLQNEMSALVDYYETLLNQLENLSLTHLSEVTSLPFNKEEALICIKSLLNACHNADAVASSLSEHLLSLCIQTPWENQAKIIYRHVDHFSFELALEKLQELMSDMKG